MPLLIRPATLVMFFGILRALPNNDSLFLEPSPGCQHPYWFKLRRNLAVFFHRSQNLAHLIPMLSQLEDRQDTLITSGESETSCFYGQVCLQLLRIISSAASGTPKTSFNIFLKQFSNYSLDWDLIRQPFPVAGLLAFVQYRLAPSYKAERSCTDVAGAPTTLLSPGRLT